MVRVVPQAKQKGRWMYPQTRSGPMPAKVSLSGPRRECLCDHIGCDGDSPADWVPCAAGTETSGKSQTPRAVPPPLPQEPLVDNVTSSSATVRWQFVAPRDALDGDFGNDSPSRPGREPTGKNSQKYSS